MAKEYLGAAASGANDLVRLVEGAMAPASGSDLTTRATASTSYVTASNTASFTMTYPASGRVLVTTSCVGFNSTAGTAFGIMSFEVRDTNSGGTVRRAVTDLGGILLGTTSTYTIGGSAVVAVTGLPTSGTMFVQPLFRSNAGTNTASFANILVTVIPLL